MCYLAALSHRPQTLFAERACWHHSTHAGYVRAVSVIFLAMLAGAPVPAGGRRALAPALAPDTDTIWRQVLTAATPSRATSMAWRTIAPGISRCSLAAMAPGASAWMTPGSITVSTGRSQPAQSPPGRVNIPCAMLFDSGRNRTVLFGGLSAAGYLNDTWEYNGANWTQRSPAVSPPARDRTPCSTIPGPRHRALRRLFRQSFQPLPQRHLGI